MSSAQFVQYLISGITSGSVYALVGLGFTIIYAVTKIINFAQGEFVMLGGLVSFILIHRAGLPLVPALILAILIAAAVGAAMYLLAIRPPKKASVVSLIIITIGVAIFVRGIAGQELTKDFVRLPSFSGEQSMSFLGAHIDPQAIWIIGTMVVVTIILHLFLNYTMVGKALKACAINPIASSLVGINPKTMALIAFVLAAAIGGIGGVVFAPLTLMSYQGGIMLGLKGFVAAAIGGFSSPVAAVFGGLLLGIVESFAVAANWGPFTSDYKDAIALVVLLFILLLRSGRLAEEERAG
jgi:branched-chain amino acid transport system permease protein